MSATKLTLPVFTFFALLSIVLIQYWGYEYPGLGIDDANIYFVYMKHVATGHGFVWNVGGEKVEGFTSFLWTITGSIIYKITPLYFGKVLMVILFALTYSTIYQVLRFVRRLNGTDGTVVASDIIILSVLLLPLGFVDWNIVSLMETGLWTFLLTTAALNICRYILQWEKLSVIKLSLLLMAMVITRPESAVYNLLLIGSILSFAILDKGWVGALKTIAIPLLAHIVAFASITLWRIFYFGFPFPNTYYAKVSASIKYNIISSANYLVLFFYNYPVNAFIIVVLCYFCFSIALQAKKKGYKSLSLEERIEVFLFILIMTGLTLPLLTGGDHFKYNRFYQPLLPLMLVAACNYSNWNKYIGMRFTAGKKSVIVLLIAFTSMMFLSSKYTIVDFTASHNRILHYPVIQDFIVSSNGREVAEKMNETFDSTSNYPSVGSLATGGFGFVYNGKTIDLMGLNNVAMAHADPAKKGYRNHASFDKKVFYDQLPDMMGCFYGASVITDTSNFILPENTETFRTDYANMVYSSYKKIYDDSKFHDAYQPALIKNKNRNFFIFDYFSNQYLKSIDSSKFTVILLHRKYKPTS